jgi:hypothetical protein
VAVELWNGSLAQVNSFIQATGTTYPVAMRGREFENEYEVIRDYYVVVDPDGVIRYKRAGININGITATIDQYLPQTDVEFFRRTAPQKKADGVEIRMAGAPEVLSIALSRSQEVTVELIDMQGRQIQKVFAGYLDAGEHGICIAPGKSPATGVRLLTVRSRSGKVADERVILK